MDLILGRLKDALKPSAKPKGDRLYMNIYGRLRDAIDEQDLPQGVQMPPTRKLAEELSISRSTVIKAYELLRLDGYLESVQGSGYTVRESWSPEVNEPQSNYAPHDYPELSGRGRAFLENVHLMNSSSSQNVAFRPGLPPLDIFPVNQWKRLTNLYWTNIKFSGLSYSPSSGINQLKSNIARYLNLSRKVKCHPEQIFIVSGSLQSLYLVGGVLIDHGDRVLMENPTFPNVISVFKSLGADVKGIPPDSEGLDASGISLDRKRAKLIHVTPSAHYPTGISMSLARRKEILHLASESGMYIVENDYEHEVVGNTNASPTIFSLDQEQRTIYLGTFNRLLHPSLRIGYMVLPPQLIPAVDAELKHSHRFVSPTTQFVLNEFIENKYLYQHIKQVVDVTRERRKVFQEMTAEKFGNFIELMPSDTLTLQSVYRLQGKVDDKDISTRLAQMNISGHPLSKCYTGKEKVNGLIFGHAAVHQSVIVRKLSKLRKQFRDPTTQIGT